MLRLIDESLSIYKMEKGSYELQPELVDIEELLSRVIRDYEQRPEAKRVQVELEAGDAADNRQGKTVRGEQLLCYSLFANLLKNAVEASEDGDTVRVTVSAQGFRWVLISLWNRQPLPREIREHFGAKFATHGKKRGTGLGVYSARLMTETQGGTLTWSSSKEEGTTITVMLPAVYTER
jgi:signal transduction histidine kinase